MSEDFQGSSANDAEPETFGEGPSRRNFLKKGALVAGASVWAVPVVQSLDARAAGAATVSPPPTTSTSTTEDTTTTTEDTTTTTEDTTTTTEDTTTTTVAPGALTGRVVDAVTGSPVIGATIKVGALTTSTNNKGFYSFPTVPAGDGLESAAKAGYVTAVSPVHVDSGATTTLNFALSPKTGDVRVVLNWNTAELDLDLHLSGPNGSGGRFHMSFDDKQPTNFVSLDRDDPDGVGPETATISFSPDTGDFVAGSYHVWVDNFTHAQPYSADEAQLVVNGLTAQVAQRQVTDATGDDTKRIWRVLDFTLDADGGVTVTDLQTFLDGDDTSVF